jgi:hypothetical protein
MHAAVYSNTSTAVASSCCVVEGDNEPRRLLGEALDAVHRDAVANTLVFRHTRPCLADRSKPFVQRYDDGDREPLTWFHSRVVPHASLDDVFDSVAKRIRTFDAATGRAAVVLMRRYSDHTGLAITTFMVHRLFLASLIVAAKAHHDLVVRNCDFARVARIDPREVYRLELALCVGVDWRTLVTCGDVDAPHCDRGDPHDESQYVASAVSPLSRSQLSTSSFGASCTSGLPRMAADPNASSATSIS